MNKIAKTIITITVFVLVILYFIVACEGPVKKPNKDLACVNLDKTLILRAEEYFANDLPQENNEVKSISIDELIMLGLIGMEDLQDVGTTCSGEISIVNVNGNYYYNDNVTCGICSTSDLYGEWSEWSEELPNIVGTKMQVETMKYYNYGSTDSKYSDWSEWGLDMKSIKEPATPSGVQIVATETEEKTQYSYRDGAFKWYKVTAASNNYYNNGSYYATSPATGYEKLESSKKIIETSKAYSTESALKSALSGKTYDIVNVNGYQVGTPRYEYSKVVTTTTPASCNSYKPNYTCYYIKTENVTSGSVATSEQEARSSCETVAGSFKSSCTIIPQTTSNTTCTTGTLSNGQCISSYAAEHVVTKREWSNCQSWNEYTTVTCSGSGVAYGRNCSNSYPDGYCYKQYGLHYACLSACTGELQCNNGGSLSGTFCVSYSAPTTIVQTTYGYSYTTSSQIYASGYYTACPSTHPYAVATGTNSNECSSWTPASSKTVVYYLNSQGNATQNTVSTAAYITDAQFAAYNAAGKGIGFTKTSNYVTDWTGTPTKGTCPSGTNATNCKRVTMYEGKIYGWKWYKSTASKKEACNNGEYSTTSPAIGCDLDKSSAKWGQWSTFSDTKATASISREVKTQKLIRFRKSYIDPNTLKLEKWLPLEEFESEVGKTIAELEKDKKIKVQSKIMYRYRTLK